LFRAVFSLVLQPKIPLVPDVGKPKKAGNSMNVFCAAVDMRCFIRSYHRP